MKRTVLVITSLALLAGACTATGGGSETSPSTITNGCTASSPKVTLNVWSFYTGREFKQYQQVLDGFTAKYPCIKITHTPGKSDQDIIRAINGGTPFDLGISEGPDSVAQFCSTGAYQDLNGFIQADKLDIATIIPEQALRYTSYNGDQCTLPVLSDAYGLYYNNAMYSAAKITSPPKTLSELETDAKKLTQFNSDGSIKVAGWVPLQSFYESGSLYLGNYTGGKWYQSDGKSAMASDPTWGSILEWEQKFITDVYGSDGYNKLQDFVAKLGGPNSEWSAANGFEVGKVAMLLDGEWRTAFIKDDKSTVDYTTAPFPVADDIASTYGRGQIGGDVFGIPRGSQHPAQAWLLLKYLATDTTAQTQLAEKLGNVPTTFESLKDPKLVNDPHFKPFLAIFANPQSGFKQLTPVGSTDQSLWNNFIDSWEAGKVPNLQSGLQGVASQIDQQTSLG
jgi:multiple sugar transport system substrate-binding protein